MAEKYLGDDVGVQVQLSSTRRIGLFYLCLRTSAHRFSDSRRHPERFGASRYEQRAAEGTPEVGTEMSKYIAVEMLFS